MRLNAWPKASGTVMEHYSETARKLPDYFWLHIKVCRAVEWVGEVHKGRKKGRRERRERVTE